MGFPIKVHISHLSLIRVWYRIYMGTMQKKPYKITPSKMVWFPHQIHTDEKGSKHVPPFSEPYQAKHPQYRECTLPGVPPVIALHSLPHGAPGYLFIKKMLIKTQHV